MRKPSTCCGVHVGVAFNHLAVEVELAHVEAPLNEGRSNRRPRLAFIPEPGVPTEFLLQRGELLIRDLLLVRTDKELRLGAGVALDDEALLRQTRSRTSSRFSGRTAQCVAITSSKSDRHSVNASFG